MTRERTIPRLLVAGRTGTGKSSLLNALLGQDALAVGVTPTTMGFDIVTWASSAGEVEVIDSRGFAEADSTTSIVGGGSVIQKGYETAHICLLVVPASERDFEPETRWVADAKRAGLLSTVPSLLIVTRIDEVPPPRDWNPSSLNLTTPRTPKEINISEKLKYLSSLSAFAEFFTSGRAVPVSAGQKSHDGNEDLTIAPFGISGLQELIFRLLPEAPKVEYARVVRRSELAKQVVDGLVSKYVTWQVMLGVAFYLLGLGCCGASAVFSCTGKVESFIGMDDTASSALSFLGSLSSLALFFVLPLLMQVLMIRDIGLRHGFSGLGVSTLLGMLGRYPGVRRHLVPQGLEWLWIAVACFCCCNPVGFGLFMTKPVARCFNQVFYEYGLEEGKRAFAGYTQGAASVGPQSSV